jgi:hypothetical protein
MDMVVHEQKPNQFYGFNYIKKGQVWITRPFKIGLSKEKNYLLISIL